MSILDKEIKTAIPIKEVTSNFLAGMGFARKQTTRKNDRCYERIKWAYKISLALPSWTETGTINIAKVHRNHGKTRYSNVGNYRVETIEQFIDIVNKHQPRETYEHTGF